MSKKIIAIILLLAIAAIPATTFGDSLVAHWKLDETSGTTAADSSGNGYDGTIYGDPNWVVGQIDGALDFNGVNDYVNTNSADLDLAGTDTITVSAWIYPRTLLGDAGHIISDYDRNNTLGWVAGFSTNDTFGATNIAATRSRSRQSSALALNEWHHVVAVIYPTDYPDIYANGQLDNDSSSGSNPTEELYMGSGNVMIGRQSNPAERYFNGLVDDVKIFNGVNSPIAHDPSPVDEDSTNADSVVLSWSPGSDAYSHDVYFGTDEAAVSSAERDIGDIDGDGSVDWFDMNVLREQWLSSPQEPFADLNGDGNVNLLDYAIFAADWRRQEPFEYKGNQANVSYTTGFLPGGVTYYWRIDEVNGTDIWKGNVWSFSTNRDLYSDTWVAVDGLGRELPGYAECGAPRSGVTTALFYYIWHGEHGTGGPYDITQLLAANPSNPSWGPEGDFHHWGESELGYYLSDDEYVMRKHAHMIADAGIDVIVFDVTNGWTYVSNYMALCQVYMDIRADGGQAPQICFMANGYADDVVDSLYNNLYSQNLYPELWFYWKGKPLILAPEDGAVIGSHTISYTPGVMDFFNRRYAWTWMSAGYDIWKWMDYYPQQYGWHESSSIAEQLSVSCGIVPHTNQGRSYQNGTQPAHNVYGLTGTEEQGLCFAEQWSRLDTIDPEFLFITQWNEWVAERQIAEEGRWFLGEQLSAGETWFIDEYNQEYSRDIEPMKGGHTDNYYYQMIDGIRRYKGVRQLPTPSAAKTISIDGSFSDWDDVGPEYRDWKADTTHRNHPGWGSAGTYTNTTGRNDFLTAKVARDSTYVYFYIETSENITTYTDPNWMMLFINADQDYADGWEGYDYVVNMQVNSAASTTLKGTSGGWNWTNVDSDVLYQVSGNRMEIRIPRSDIGQGSGAELVAFDFHWADNIVNDDDITEFAVSGDSAPDRRFNYRYKYYITPTVVNSAATNIHSSSATLNGEVTDTGGEAPIVTIYWGDNDAGTTAGNWDSSIAKGTQSSTYSSGISSLDPETTYYFRSYATNSAGNDWADSTAQFDTTVAGDDVAQIGSWVDGDWDGYDHADPAGSNRVLLVFCHAEENDAPTDFLTVTYGGQTCTQVVERLQDQGGSYSATAEIWILDEAGIAAAGANNTIVVTSSGEAETRRISSVFYENVDQSDPTGQIGTDGDNDNGTKTLTVSLSGGELDSGDMVVANCTVRNQQSGTTTFTWGNGLAALGDYNPSGNPYLTYGDADRLADGTSETASVQIAYNGVGALAVCALNHGGAVESTAPTVVNSAATGISVNPSGLRVELTVTAVLQD